MSHPGDFNDYMEDNSQDLIESWLEDERHYKLFTDWLFNSKQDELRDALFESFINQYPASTEAMEFEEWCRDKFNSRPEPDND